MNPYLDDAIQEVKRVDHLVHVSLKYTRTVDVLRSVVDRIISTFDLAMEGLLNYLKEEKKINDIPSGPGLRVDALKTNLKDDAEMQDYLSFYLSLRRLMRAEYTKREEYRRHVTMISTLDDGNKTEINIDILVEYHEKTKNFLKHLMKMIEGEKNE